MPGIDSYPQMTSPLTGTENFIGNQGGVTKRATPQQIVNDLGGGLANVTTTDPVATDDSGSGYQAGSRWVNTTNNTIWVCYDATLTAAVWERIGGPKLNPAGGGAPTVSNDNTQGYEAGSIWIDEVNDAVYFCESAGTGAASWIQSGGGGGSGDVNASAGFLTLSVDQTTSLAANDPIQFDTLVGSIVFNSGTYRVTVPAGKEAVLEGTLYALLSDATTVAEIQWYDVTNAAYVGSIATLLRLDRSPTAATPSTTAAAQVAPSVDTVYELRVKTLTSGTITTVQSESSFAKVTIFSTANTGPLTVVASGSESQLNLTLDNLTEFDFEVYVPAAAADAAKSIRCFINGDATETNYRSQYLTSSDVSLNPSETDSAYAGRFDDTYASLTLGRARVVDGIFIAHIESTSHASPTSTFYQLITLTKETATTDVTSVSIRTSDGSNFPSGSVLVVKSTTQANAPADSYSLTEIPTNKRWIDGKTIYRKVVDMGSGLNGIPTIAYKSVPHGVTGVDRWTGISLNADNGTVSYTLTNVAGTNEAVYRNGVNIVWSTISDRTTYTGYAILEYTKT